jgi:peptidase E
MILIGGGELRSFTTLDVDAYAVSLIRKPEGERINALFFPTAAHDSKPYFNTFRKTYTSRLGAKVDVALVTTGEMTMDYVQQKIDKADIIYLSGGDTAYMLESLRRTGADLMIRRAYESGKLIVGLSAGAIGWFEYAHSDYAKMRQEGDDYLVIEGMGVVEGICVPHYDEESRRESASHLTGYKQVLCIESDCGVLVEDEKIIGSVGPRDAYLDGEKLPKID